MIYDLCAKGTFLKSKDQGHHWTVDPQHQDTDQEHVYSFPATPLLSANTVYYLAFNNVNDCGSLFTPVSTAFIDGGANGSFNRLYHIITMKIAGGNLITIEKGDSVQANIEIALKITGIDSAVASIAETEIPLDIPEILFPSVAEIFSGKLKSPSAADVNEIYRLIITRNQRLFDFMYHFWHPNVFN